MKISPDRIRIVTERLVIRPIKPDDFEIWRTTLLSLGTPKNVWDHGGEPPANLTRSAFETLVRDRHRLIELDRYYLFSVWTEAEDRWLGNVSLMDVSRGIFQNAYLGYSIFHDFWRQGYGYESVRALILFGFDVLDLHRVEAGIEPDNAASKRLAEKLGLRFEGRSERRLYVRDAWRTIDIYALTREERDVVS